ncbi:MAG: nucleotide sugar dehydrogenase [Candidatus Hydrothermarchaeaceae archaeon]
MLKKSTWGRNIGIIGLGYVGLPTAALLADRGYRVRGGDINKRTVETINAGRSTINEAGMNKLVSRVVKKGLLSATDDIDEVVKRSEVVFVIVQTPISEDKSPDLDALKNACATVAKNLRGEMLVIFESTIPPGAMEETIIPILESNGREAGKDFYLAYSPERAMPTHTLEEIQKNPRVIGGIDKRSAELARGFYRDITSGELITVDIKTAEVVKIIENTYRDVNIALANEIALVCEKLGVDAIEAIKLANRHPRVNIHLPGAGVGGHCVPKDPYFLIHKAGKLGLELRVISSARKVNESMPGHILELIKNALAGIDKKVEDSKVAVLGIAYKGDADDIRGTPSKEIIETLIKEECNVFSHDPLLKHDFGGKFSNNIEKVIEDSDCVVIVTDHSIYRRLDLKELTKNLKKPGAVVDGRRIFNPREVEDAGITYFGVGY